MRTTFYYCNTYRINFEFFIGTDEKKLKDYLKKKYSLTDFETAGNDGLVGITSDDQYEIILIYVRNRNDILSLHHECNHAAMFALDARGVEIDTSNHEAFTYLSDEIFSYAIKKHKIIEKISKK